jgi:hypothetical protein
MSDGIRWSLCLQSSHLIHLFLGEHAPPVSSDDDDARLVVSEPPIYQAHYWGLLPRVRSAWIDMHEQGVFCPFMPGVEYYLAAIWAQLWRHLRHVIRLVTLLGQQPQARPAATGFRARIVNLAAFARLAVGTPFTRGLVDLRYRQEPAA